MYFVDGIACKKMKVWTPAFAGMTIERRWVGAVVWVVVRFGNGAARLAMTALSGAGGL